MRYLATLLFATIFLVQHTTAQTTYCGLTYYYDNAGNRIQRIVTTDCPTSGEAATIEIVAPALGIGEGGSQFFTGTDLGNNAQNWLTKNWYLNFQPYQDIPIIYSCVSMNENTI